MGERRQAIVLTVDLGNSFAKLCAFVLGDDTGRSLQEGRPIAQTVLSWDENTSAEGMSVGMEAELSAWINEVQSNRTCIEACLVSSVVGRTRTDAACRVLSNRGRTRVLRAPSVGLNVDTLAPERVGQDRLYAARGALEWLSHRSSLSQESTGSGRWGALVLDAGTALTVDALLLDPIEGATFLGGAIAPGPKLLAETLAQQAAQLPSLDPSPGAMALGRDTPSAMQAGIVVGFRGAAARLVRELETEAELKGAPLFLTGGARRFLLEPEAFLSQREMHVDEWLVEHGLLAAYIGAESA